MKVVREWQHKTNLRLEFLLRVDTVGSGEYVIKQNKHVADDVEWQVITAHSNRQDSLL